MIRYSLFAAAFALSVAATPTYAFVDSEATFDKTLSVGASPTVVISTGSGYTHVTAGPDNQFHIIGHVHAHLGWLFSSANEDSVKQIAANPPISQSGNNDHRLRAPR